MYFNPVDTSTKYFEYTSITCFSKVYLDLADITYNITFSDASFKSRAEVYDSCHGAGDGEKLNDLISLGRRKCAINDKWKIS